MDSSGDRDHLEFIEVGSSSELEEGDRMEILVDGQSFLLVRVDGKLYAVEETCSHEDESLTDGELDGHEIICPRHGARFDLHSGKATALPAVIALKTLVIREKDGKIEVGLPKDNPIGKKNGED